jgi:uncharacterized membrane protein
MIAAPIAPLLLLLFILLVGVFIFLIQIRVLSYAYRKIGVRPRYVFLVMVLTLVGSQVNIPLYTVPVTHVAPPHTVSMFGRDYVVPPSPRPGATVVAINVGGALIPILVSIYLIVSTGMIVRMALATVIVALIVNRLAQIVPGVGIAVPMIVPPLAAAGVALLLAFRRAPPVAYVAGSMGALIGADLMNLRDIAAIGAPVVSIGGAGTFDGVFLTGIIAGLIA